MSAIVSRVWGWVSPANLYSTWGSKSRPEKALKAESETKGRWDGWGVTTWVWTGRKSKTDHKAMVEEFWDTEESVKTLEVEELSALTRLDDLQKIAAQSSSRWWRRILPSSFYFCPRWLSIPSLGFRKSQESARRPDEVDGESDYGTPPPSPTPLSRHQSAFQFFSRSWSGEVLPEHFEICFNFLRHLFDLFVVGFLSTVSPPARIVLDVLGVQGAAKLWLHGMVMFLVSSVGMAGLLWVVQEYLLQFAFIYGVVQALVISVSVRQNESLREEDEEAKDDEDEDEDLWDQNQQQTVADLSYKSLKQRR